MSFVVIYRTASSCVQARYVAALLAGTVALPSLQEMEADIDAQRERLKAQGVPERYVWYNVTVIVCSVATCIAYMCCW